MATNNRIRSCSWQVLIIIFVGIFFLSFTNIADATIGLRAGQASNNGSGGTTMTMTTPAGVTAGDVMLMSVTARGGTGTTLREGNMVVATPTVGAGAYAVAITPNGAYTYVANYSSGTVSVIRTSDNTVVSTPTVGGGPHAVVITPNGAYVYVANYTDGTVSVIRTSDNTVISTPTVGTSPFSVVITPDGAYVYVTNSGGTTVSVIRTSDNTVVSTISVGSSPRIIAITPNGAYVYAINYTGNSVSVIRTSDNTVIATPPVGTNPSSIAITPNGAYAYVTNYVASTTVSVIRTSDNTVINTVTVGSAPRNVVITPDGAYAYVANYLGNSVSVIRTSDNTVIATPSVANNPYAMTVTPDGAYVYVANYTGNNVSVIRTSDNTVVTTPAVGANPFSIAITSDGAYVYVPNYTDGTVSVIRTSTWNLLSRVDSGVTLAQAIYWKVAGSEPSNYTITLTSALASGVIIALSGASPVSPVAAQFGGQANASSVTVTAPALGSWTSSNGIDVGLFGTAYGTTFTAPGSYTEPANSDGKSTGTNLATASEGSYRVLSAVTTVGSIAATAANAAVNIGHHVFIMEAPQILDHYDLAVVSPQTAGVCSTGVNAVTAKDSGGSIIASDTSTVNMTSSGTGVTFYTASDCATSTTQYTLSSGVANIYYKTNTAQNFTITATKASSTETGTSSSITVLAIGLRAAQTGNNGSGSLSLSITKPAGTATGDVMLMNVTARGGTGTVVTSGADTRVTTTGIPNQEVAHPDGTRIYIATSGVASIDVLHTVDNSITTITVSGNPSSVSISPNGAWVYVATGGGVNVIDTSTDTVVATVTLANYTYNGNDLMRWTPDSAYVYLMHWGSNDVEVIRASDHTIVASPACYTPISIGITPNGQYVYCASRNINPSNRYLTKISTSTRTVTSTIILDTNNIITNNPMVFMSDSSYLYLGVPGTNTTVRRLNVNDNSSIDITLGSFTQQVIKLAITPDNAYVYAGIGNGDDVVTAIRTSDNILFATLPAGLGRAYGIAVTPDGKYVYVATNSMQSYIVRVSDNAVLTYLTGGMYSLTMLPDFSKGYSDDQSSTIRVIDFANAWMLLSTVNSTTNLQQTVWWRAATSSEPSSYVMAIDAASGTTRLASGTIVALSGADQSIPASAQIGGQANASSTTVTAPALGSWTSTNGIDVGMFGTAYGTTFTPPGSYTEPANSDGKSTGTTLATASEGSYQALSAVTTVGSIAATAVNAAVNIGHHVFIKEQQVAQQTRLVVTLPGETFIPGSGNSGTDAHQIAGTQFTISSITATDDNFNVATGYSGTKTLVYSGPSGSPTYTTSVSFTNGVSTTSLLTTLPNAETTTITVTDGGQYGYASSSLLVIAGGGNSGARKLKGGVQIKGGTRL